MPYVVNDAPLSSGQPFTVGEVQYPANVLDLWTVEELAEIGVTWVEPETAPMAAQLEAVADRRWRCLTGPLDHDGETVTLLDGDTLARLDAQIATMGLNSLTTLWEIRRGVFVEMDSAACRSLRAAIAARMRAAYQRSAELSAAITAGDAPDIESGWPG